MIETVEVMPLSPKLLRRAWLKALASRREPFEGEIARAADYFTRALDNWIACVGKKEEPYAKQQVEQTMTTFEKLLSSA